MSIVPGNSRVQIRDSRFEIRNSRGFTLLEIILAMAILGMMSLAIYRFVQSNLIAMRASSQASAAEAPYGGLRDLLTEQWQGLPQGRGGLSGEPFKLNDRQRDEIRWKCSAGSGLLTRYAGGEFMVLLRLQPQSEKSDQLDLGLLRKPADDTGAGPERESWVPLIKNVRSLQIGYFEPRLQLGGPLDRLGATASPGEINYRTH